MITKQGKKKSFFFFFIFLHGQNEYYYFFDLAKIWVGRARRTTNLIILALIKNRKLC